MNSKLGSKGTDAVDRSGSVQKEARALGDPTRYRLFRYIADAKRPVYIHELTALFMFNHNAVRQHLAVLKEASLVEEELEKRSRPGRPRLSYRVNPNYSGSWGTEGPYRRVAMLLADVIKSKRTAVEVGRSEGRRRARELSENGNLMEMIYEDLQIDGFHPTAVSRENGHDFVLGRCPYAEVASFDPQTICQLHLGFLEGITEKLDEEISVKLSVRDPRRAGCCVTIRSLVR